MGTFQTRAISAIIFAILLIGGILWCPLSLFVIILIVLIGSIFEYYRIMRPMYRKDKGRSELYRNLSLVLGIYAVTVAALANAHYLRMSWLFSIPLLIAAIFYLELILRSKKPFRNIGLNLLSMYYIAMPLALSFFIVYYPGFFAGEILLGVLFIIWANDSGAYIVGSLIGRNKLLEHVSPNKTIEGFIGGGVFCLLVAYLITHWLNTFSVFYALNYIKDLVWYLIAITVFIFATMGDLIESLLKRSLDIKDSGNIMPGHGGFLDRFDAFLFVLPFVVAIIKIFNPN